MPRTTPSEVLDLQGHVSALMHNPNAATYTSITAESILRDTSAKRQEHVGETITESICTLSQAAHTYHVAAEMTDLVIAAANGLDDLMPWRVEFLPTPSGFAYFDQPLLTEDIRGRMLKTHAILWGPIQTSLGTATAVYCFNDVTDPDETMDWLAETHGFTIDYLREQFGRLQMFHMNFLLPEQRVGPARWTPSEDRAQEIREEGDEPHEGDNIERLFVGYMRLLGQTLVKSSPAHIDRHAAKRAKRKGLPALVTTVQLRRITYINDHGEETHVEWNHRWLVRSHWRRQPCGPTHPLAEPDGEGGFIAYILIAPYIKGPDDKPLVLTKKVIDLIR